MGNTDPTLCLVSITDSLPKLWIYETSPFMTLLQ